MAPLSSYPFRIGYGPGDDRLHEFYIPALERSVRYDRAAGFFSSGALAVAAAGLARLIANGGRMRLLCGAQLSPADVEAIRRGVELKEVVGEAMAGCLADPKDRSLRGRLEALAWMVGQGLLEIRVVLPRGEDGHPLPADEAWEYYHPKEGIFTDAEGEQLAFSGSSNESETGWRHNYETFTTHASWERQEGADRIPPGRPYIRIIERRFESLWSGQEEAWTALEIPEAARRRLLSYRPATPPIRDPLERVPPELPRASSMDDDRLARLERERLLFRFLQEAPYLPDAEGLGTATCALRPWPHQLRVARESVKRFPESFLFCDEVGLGKTVEAGLILRQLVISGRVRRALLLVPKSVLRQWQEELYEKFVLNVPRYEDGGLFDVFNRPLPQSSRSVWSSASILLASSQLAKRRDRQGDLLAAEPWDLILVDEAHHARRKDFLSSQYRPNRLLELLVGTSGRPGLKDQTRCLYLLTATPMQVHPVEVWDLLRALGMGGRWGALDENFLRFFEELRRPLTDRDWDFLLNMLQDFLETGGALDLEFCRTAERELGPVEWDAIRSLLSTSKRQTVIAQLDVKGKAVLNEMIRRHTPLSTLVWRSTRRLLRRYREAGLLRENVPERDPRNEWIPMKDEERTLYERIEEYISDFYQKYEAERKGLGFVMTVYRRRLTSSFYAMRKSLERRLDFLQGRAAAAGGLTEEDFEQEDLDLDISEMLSEESRDKFRGEIEYILDFLHELSTLGSDSKLERLLRDLRAFFQLRETVIVFTQYTDTMDYLREELRQVYGSQVACYSGRGGEVWDGVAWVPRSKESLKEAFRQGEEIKALLCTESASEGLNLQTCGILINFDMPWNPMRVEQRIGRIDRIGQKHERVWIRNYFYEDTVEATIYRRLEDRIDWFVSIIGELQPILHRVGQAIQAVAMLRREQRIRRLEEEIADLREKLDHREAEGLDLDAYAEDLSVETEQPSPVTLGEIESILVGSVTLGRFFTQHPEIERAYLLTWRGEARPVTFSPEVFDRHPNTVEMISYGSPTLEELLTAAGDPTGSHDPTGIGVYRSREPVPVSLVFEPGPEGVRPIENLQDFRESLQSPGRPWSEMEREQALVNFRKAQQGAAERLWKVSERHRQAERLALIEAARRVLVKAALVELARAQVPGLFEEVLPYGFGEEAVVGLGRHGAPFRALLRMTGPERLEARPTDSFFLDIQGRPLDQLQRRWEALRHQGEELVRKYAGTLGGAESRAWAGGDALELRWYSAAVESSEDTPVRDQKARVLPFRILSREEVRPFENCVPLYEDIQIPAGFFSEEQPVNEAPLESSMDPDEFTWVELPLRIRPSRDLFVARVVGRSMDRRIPDGSYCLFRFNPGGGRGGRVVLARHPSIVDRDLGGHYTLKVYESEKLSSRETWRHRRVILKPDSSDPSYEPLVFEDLEEGKLAIIAELVEVLASPPPI